MAHAYIGTSGWNYRQWRGSFFPETLPAKRWLSYYASRFDSVEVNYSFYRLPSTSTCEAWYEQTPERFCFAMKASRYITHVKRLRDVREAWNTFLERALILKHKLGPILLQFPSNFRASESNLEAIDEFLKYAACATHDVWRWNFATGRASVKRCRRFCANIVRHSSFHTRADIPHLKSRQSRASSISAFTVQGTCSHHLTLTRNSSAGRRI